MNSKNDSGGKPKKQKRQRVKSSPRRVRDADPNAKLPFEGKKTGRPASESAAPSEGKAQRRDRRMGKKSYDRKEQTREPLRDVNAPFNKESSKSKTPRSKDKRNVGDTNAAPSSAERSSAKRNHGKIRDLVAGLHPVEEMLKHRSEIAKVLFADRGTPAVEAICKSAEDAGIAVQERTKEQLDAMTRGVMHQRVVLETRAFPYIELADRFDDATLLCALDGVEDPRNLGRVARACAVFGVDALALKKDRSVKVGVAAHKTSAGAFATLDVALMDNLARSIEAAQNAGFWVYGASAEGDVAPHELDLSGKVMWVIGGENSGLSALSRKKCDRVVRIPMKSQKLMLNAADAATVLLYESARQRALLAE